MIGRWRYCETSWLRRGFLCRRLQLFSSHLVLFFLVFLTACQEEILHDLSEREANKVLSHLSTAHLGATKVLQADGRWAIAVAQDEIVPALMHLDVQRVLTGRGGGAHVTKGSMIPSREEQWFRFERSLATSIEESLAAIPGVLEARVHVNVPEEDPLFASNDRGGGSGSVLLVVDDTFAAQDEEISALVAGAAGIPRDVVRVLKSHTPVVRPAKESADTPSESRRDHVTEPLQSSVHAYSHIPWVGALGVCVIVLIGLSARKVVARKRKNVTFSLPKELDFEG